MEILNPVHVDLAIEDSDGADKQLKDINKKFKLMKLTLKQLDGRASLFDSFL